MDFPIDPVAYYEYKGKRMSKKYKPIFVNETIELSQGPDGFWLYDRTRGMNLSMRAVSEQQAFVNTIIYYQRRLTKIEKSYKSLNGFVNTFIEQVQYGSDDD